MRNSLDDRKHDRALALWSAGRNTWDIARELGEPESSVANMLPRLIERRKAEKLPIARNALRTVERRVGVEPYAEAPAA